MMWQKGIKKTEHVDYNRLEPVCQMKIMGSERIHRQLNIDISETHKPEEWF